MHSDQKMNRIKLVQMPQNFEWIEVLEPFL